MQRINKPRFYGTRRRIQAGLWGLLCGLALLVFPWHVQAEATLPPRPTATAPSLLPPRPTAVPPRPTPVPTPTAVPEAVLQGSRATITLQAVAYEGAWTVVQWRGDDGVWHDVTGWRGHVRNGQVRWRVASKDFGTGPFRWVVYDEPGGRILALSAPFTLPGSPYGQIQVPLAKPHHLETGEPTVSPGG